MYKVLCVLPMSELRRNKLLSVAENCELCFADKKCLDEKLISSADIILGNVPADMIKASPKLKLLQLESAGTDAYIVPGVLDTGTVLANSTGAYGKAVSEHGFALTLTLLKKLYLYRDAQQRGQWVDMGMVKSLSSCTVIIAGLGDIGEKYAKLVKALGAYTIGVKRRPAEKPECVDELYSSNKLDEILPRADVVFSVLPNTTQTRYIYTDRSFDLMKEDAVFINCGRGNAVSSDVLYRALSQHKISAAAIDVTDPEPLPSNSPLWSLENLVITPHVSGGEHLPETFEHVIDIAAENLVNFQKGLPIRNEIDFSTGYKK